MLASSVTPGDVIAICMPFLIAGLTLIGALLKIVLDTINKRLDEMAGWVFDLYRRLGHRPPMPNGKLHTLMKEEARRYATEEAST